MSTLTLERQTFVYQNPEPSPTREPASPPERTGSFPIHADLNALLFRSADVDLYADRLDTAWAICTRRRIGLLALCVLLGLLWSAARISRAPTLYEAHGEIKLKKAQIHLGRSLGSRLSKHAVADEAAFLTSDSALRRVALKLDLAHNDAFLNRKARRDGQPRPPAPMDQVISRLYYGIAINSIQRSPLIAISFVSRDPLLTQSVVNTVIDTSRERGSDTDLARIGITTAFFAGRINELKQQVDNEQQTEELAERKLGVGALVLQNNRNGSRSRTPFDLPSTRSTARTFGLPAQTSVFSIDSAINQRDLPLDILSRAARQAKLSRQLAEARQTLLEKLGPEKATGDLAGANARPTQPLLELRQDIAAAQAEYAGLATSEGSANPDRQSLRAQIDSTSQLLGTLQQQQLRREQGFVNLARARDLALRSAVEDRLAEANRIRYAEIDTSMLRLNLALDRSIFEDLRSRLVAAQLDASIGSTDIDVIDRAFYPNAPLPRDYRGPILLGIGFGLLGGSLVWILLYLRDSKLLAIPELENTADLPVLSALPFTVSSSPRSTNAAHAPNPELCAALYSLRDNLIRIAPAGGARRILFTSSLPGEGKTTTATNFAVALARGVSGQDLVTHGGDARSPSVLLIDTDMHRPAVHHRFQISSRTGLSTVLAGDLSLAQAVQTIPNEPRLHILTAGPIPPRPSELLLSAGWAAVLQQASDAYDYVILDTPPMLATSDALILAAQVEAMFLVARYGRINGRLLRRSRYLWERSGVRPAGAILNGIPDTL